MDSDRRAARAGNFYSYLRIAGHQGHSSARLMFSTTKLHQHIVETAMADLMCRRCKKFHMQDNTFFLLRGGHYQPTAVTCPNCGLENCAGPRRHAVEAPRGSGKSELVDCADAFRFGLSIARGRPIQGMLIGANQDEARKRLGFVKAKMQTAGHGVIFPEAIASARSRAGTVAIKGGKGLEVYTGYGILGIPPGHHVDRFRADDVCNQNNTLLKPAEMIKVWEKWANVAENSLQPWSVIDYQTTPWRAGDTTSKLRTFASANRTVVMDSPLRIELLEGNEWLWLAFAAGGAPDFASHWPEKHTPEELRRLYSLDPRAYERAYMMREIADAEIAFRDIQFFWQKPKDYRTISAAALAQLLRLPSVPCHPRELPWPKMVGYDPAFSGSDKPGHSKHGFSVVMLDPEKPLAYVVYANEQYMAPEDVKEELLRLCANYGTMDVAIEDTGVVEELKQYLTSRGLNIYPYSPGGKTFGGSKEFRKSPVAEAVNDGRLLLRGQAKIVESGSGIIGIGPQKFQEPLYDAMRIFPAEKRDILDALEIAVRMLWLLYGQYPVAKTSRAEAKSYIDRFTEDVEKMYLPEPEKQESDERRIFEEEFACLLA
jgi:hypothetical protein